MLQAVDGGGEDGRQLQSLIKKENTCTPKELQDFIHL